MPAQYGGDPKWAPIIACPNPAKLAQARPMPVGHWAVREWARAFQMGFTYAAASCILTTLLLLVDMELKLCKVGKQCL